MNKVLSFIIPVYNAQTYLRDCLDSILMQNVDNNLYEIVCVNDGSKDESLQILREYEQKYKNVIVIDKENSGVSLTRNVGIEKSCGEYIWFVDSDDCITPNCLNQLINFLIKKKPECVKIDFISIGENYIIQKNHEKELKFDNVNNSVLVSTVWSIIIKSDIIKLNNIKFLPNMKYGEDTLFAYKLFICTSLNNSYKINVPLYCYRTNMASVTQKKDVESMNIRANDLLTIAREYQKIYNNKVVDDINKLNNARKKQCETVIGYLAILPQTSLDLNQCLNLLKQEKLYPYPFLINIVKTQKSIKLKIKNLLLLFLRFEFIYKIYYKLKKTKCRRS